MTVFIKYGIMETKEADNMPSHDISEILVQNDVTMVDTCTIMQPSFIDLMRRYVKYDCYKKYHISVHCSVINELLAMKSNSDKNSEIRETAYQRVQLLTKMKHYGMINFTGEVNEYFFDNQMLSYMIKNRCNEHIALITQDKNLMGDIILMNRMSSFTGNDVNVYTLNNKGHIITIV